jgi:hypothetical protein
MKIKNRIIALIISLIALPNFAFSAENQPYAYGGLKVYNYGITTTDLQNINTSIINLGYSSSYSSTDNRGYGFDLGLGYDVSKNIAFEVGYTNFGTLTINNLTTGPVTSNTLDITVYSLGAGVLGKFGENDKSYGYVKAGLHNWDFTGTVSTARGSSSEALGTGTDPIFSIGYRSEIAQLSFDGYKINDGWIKALTLGVKYNF